MALEPGTWFGSYEVAESIGAGGMGEVYRATDLDLKRDVALKVLPQAFVEDADRLARFQREAEILASLNHPNIAQVYGLEKADGATAIVMELVEGPTLADRIKDGPIPPDEAISISLQVLSALEAAHLSQIVHRDLKPANVKVKDDGTVKVLDFGISKPVDPEAISGSAVATTPAVTQTGVILGTAAYMSPEQARGKFVDQRTDVWAFGCLLFEMLTGQPAFGGEDVMLTLARVLDRDTDLSSIPKTISPAVRHTLKLCLEKDPKKRIADIRDVRLALEGGFETELSRAAEAAAQPASSRVWPLAIAAALAAVLVGATVWILKPLPPREPAIVTRFNYALPDGVSLRNTFTSVLDVAPSGEFFVVNGSDGIYLRPMGSVAARVIAGTGAPTADVVVSPDGRDIVFFRVRGNQQLELVKVAIGGGAPIVLAESLGTPFGLSWESDGTILFGQLDGVWRVSETGGTPVRLIETEGVEQVYGPQLLPDGEWLLFTLARTGGENRWDEADIVVESLTTGERRLLRSGGFDARYLPTGHLTYIFENVLFASAFDAAMLELDDERVSLIQGVTTAIFAGNAGGSGFYSAADNGTLVYIPGTPAAGLARPERNLVWVDRRGSAEPLPIRPDDYTTARISPDGTKVALVVGSALPRSDPAPDIYIFDLETENLTQLTFDAEADDGPVWSRDGDRIFFRSYREEGVPAVYTIPADGGAAELLVRPLTNRTLTPWSVSADGETMLLVDSNTLRDLDISVLEIDADDEVTPLIDNDTWVNEPVLSPNGEWIAHFSSDQPSDPAVAEINIRPFPNVTQQRRPVGSGVHPAFSADGSEIFFDNGEGLSAAAVEYMPLRVANPETLFRGVYWYGSAGPITGGRAWDVDPNNDRFLMITAPGGAGAGDADQSLLEINVILNWFEELNERVPAD